MAAPEAHQTRILFDDNSFDDELTRSLFNVLKATLEYPASRCAKARKLVIDMLYFCVASDDDPANFFDIWHVFFDIISYIPPDHEWQLCLGDALDILRQDLDRYIGSDSTLFTPEEKETLSSAEWLPELKMATVVYWNGFANPSTIGESTPDPLLLQHWQNFNSFFARYSKRGHPLAQSFGLAAIQVALEEPPAHNSFSDPLAVCKLWVATEWLTQCSNLIYKELKEPEKGPYSGKGSLCSEDIQPHSVERWQYWGERLLQIKKEVSADHGARLLEAVHAMNMVEQQN